MVLTCISLMIQDVERLFMYLLAIWKNVSLVPGPIFNWTVVELCKFVYFGFEPLIGGMACKIFLRSCGLPFHPVGCAFCCAEGFWFDEFGLCCCTLTVLF